MPNQVAKTLIAAGALIAATPAIAQEEFTVHWHTVDCGGGASAGSTTSEDFLLLATIAQPDAGYMSGGGDGGEPFSITGGYWAGHGDGGSCYPNCDGSTGNPVLTPNDFMCFLNSYVSGRPYANCDGSTASPVLTPNDFQCFLDGYAAGCP